ncbi:2-amino-4-hydroxy-6-hydroxymethyldihydropteridine diphosphokinase [Holophaga foetida]|uniref:2-amino-4-hydroxy-6- hydroxymethyldihydropteridine diphosphokinase n=1 Tax=Holophaga foetida TaxID=35839 RepID=UPI0002473700|nr:2-amino-4-hydroxy-6-hydroxymethyldihydropteridine diphosphokinase [Holophaga foetida]
MRVIVALGSNLGDRQANLEAGLAALLELGKATPSPMLMETPDESGTGPAYMNTVALLETSLELPRLLEELLRREIRLGRRRDGVRNAPRPLDLDLIAAEGQQGSWRWPSPPDLACLGAELTLELPHPRARGRAFVMEPWIAMGQDLPESLLP